MVRVIVITAVLFIIHTASLFGAAGTISWPMAWAVLGVYFLSQTFSLIFISPDLLRERASPGQGVEPFDRLIATSGYLGLYTGTLIVSGLDAIRFGPTLPFQYPLKIAAFIIFVFGYAIGTWAAYTNRFFSTFVRIQKDRGHSVISSGPYAWIRHPGYAGILLAHLALPFVLGSIWALLPAIIGTIFFVIRTIREDQILSEKLVGYSEYQKKVRWRLLPWVW